MINFTLRQLQIFDAVSNHLSYSRAAEALYLTQPAVSMQIRQLEDNLGIPLLEQMGKKIYLTTAGQEFLVYCRNILQQVSNAEAMIGELKGTGGKLSIDAATTAGHFTPQLLAEFCKQHPYAKVSLNVTNRENLLQRLDRNEMDMAIMGRPPEGLDLDATPFMENHLVIIAPANHPLVGEKSIPMSRLADETFLVREQGSGTRSAMERYFSDRHIRLNTGTEMNTNEAIKQAVQAGMGLGILSLHTVRLEMTMNHLVVLDVENFPILRHWYIIHRRGKRLSGVAQAFKAFLLHTADTVMADTRN